MIVDPKTKVAFIHNPKAGGTSMRTALLKQLGCADTFRYQGWFQETAARTFHMHNMSHLEWDAFLRVMRSRETEYGKAEDYKFFGMVRNPLHRFCSSIREFEVKHHQWWTKFNMPLIDFLWEMLTPESIWLPEFSWFKPQMSYFPIDGSDFKCTVVPVDSLTQEHALWEWLGIAPIKMQTLNQKGSDKWFSELPDTQKEKVSSMCASLYRSDHKTLGYDLVPATLHNMDSYMWKVRSIQGGKLGISTTPPAEDTNIFQQIVETTPPIIK
jgi:hypothetical protein